MRQGAGVEPRPEVVRSVKGFDAIERILEAAPSSSSLGEGSIERAISKGPGMDDTLKLESVSSIAAMAATDKYPKSMTSSQLHAFVVARVEALVTGANCEDDCNTLPHAVLVGVASSSRLEHLSGYSQRSVEGLTRLLGLMTVRLLSLTTEQQASGRNVTQAVTESVQQFIQDNGLEVSVREFMRIFLTECLYGPSKNCT